MEETKVIEWLGNNIEWIFSGIGTLFIGAFLSYKFLVRSHVKQIQRAGNNTKQYQNFTVKNSLLTNFAKAAEVRLEQTQEAGDDVLQKQIGDTHNDG